MNESKWNARKYGEKIGRKWHCLIFLGWLMAARSAYQKSFISLINVFEVPGLQFNVTALQFLGRLLSKHRCEGEISKLGSKWQINRTFATIHRLCLVDASGPAHSHMWKTTASNRWILRPAHNHQQSQHFNLFLCSTHPPLRTDRVQLLVYLIEAIHCFTTGFTVWAKHRPMLAFLSIVSITNKTICRLKPCHILCFG